MKHLLRRYMNVNNVLAVALWACLMALVIYYQNN